MNKWNYCDEVLPPDDTEVAVLVAEDYNDGKGVFFDTDIATWHNGQLSVIGNDWDEGQRWGVVAWTALPDLPSKDEVIKHKWIL